MSGEPSASPPRQFVFGPFAFDEMSGELHKHGIRVRLEGQPLQILAALVRQPGQVVSREEFQQRIWKGGTFVDFDHGLNTAMNRLRQVLGDSADQPRYIETLPGRGYRFVAPVEAVRKPVLVMSSPPIAAGEAKPEAEVSPGAFEPGALQKVASAPSAGFGRSYIRFGWIGAAVAAALFIAFFAARLVERPADAPVVRFNVFPPVNTAFGNTPTLAVSPDGRRLAFVTVSKEGYQLWLRPLDALAALPLAHVERGSVLPFWSPGSRSLAFFAEGKLTRIDLNGPTGAGQAVTLCDTNGDGLGGTGNREGVILFATTRGILYRVADTGGLPAPASRLDGARHEKAHRFPWFLPDGRHFLFAALAALTHEGSPNRVTIRVGSLDSQESKVIREAESNAIFVQGRLIFVQEDTLMAQSFDSRRLAVTGDAMPVAEQIVPSPLVSGSGFFSGSENGPLVYFAGPETSPFELVWFDRDGNQLHVLGAVPALPDSTLEFSPDQRSLALTTRDRDNTDIWLYDLARGLRTRFTFDPAKEVAAVWSPEGRTIAFNSNRKGHFDLYRRSSDGSSAEELLYGDSEDKYPTSWSPDGKFLLYDRYNDKTGFDIWVLPLTPEQPGGRSKPFPFSETPAHERNGHFSPDGRWIAYESTESVEPEVYLAPFRAQGGSPGGKRQVSTAGHHPRWRKDGKEIFYQSGRKLMAAAVDIKDNTVQVGEERQVLGSVSILGYDISADGQRFLVLLRNQKLASLPLTVVQNWMAALKK